MNNTRVKCTCGILLVKITEKHLMSHRHKHLYNMILNGKTPKALEKINKPYKNEDEIKNENIIYFHNREIQIYKKTIKKLIQKKLSLKNKKFIHEPTFFGNNSPEYIKFLETSLKVRQIQMKEGDIAQIAIGNFYGWKDLKYGHPSGLDCIKKDNSIIMEIKNKYNTCNAGSQKAILDKLAQYKKTNSKTMCVWAIVNPNPKCKNLTETIEHCGVKIEKIQGLDLFKLVFNIDNVDYSQKMIECIKNIVYDNN